MIVSEITEPESVLDFLKFYNHKKKKKYLQIEIIHAPGI